jgi:leucyl aminopeptidase
MVARAEQLIQAHPTLSLEVFAPERLAAEGFGGLIAVGGGAASGRGPGSGWAPSKAVPPLQAQPIQAGWLDRSPRLAVLRYEPGGPAGCHLGLVGKGITFDSGGLDIKPAGSMTMMKTDMAGAGAVLAAVVAAAQLELPVRLTAVLPLAENGFGAASYRPGDVVRVFGGASVEVGDTDAEGRLVLADGLAWLDQVVRPDLMVDVATLTGAARIGLGKTTAALFASTDHLAGLMEAAAAAAGEPAWRLPLVEGYEAALDSELADVSSTATPGTGAGAVTAALFLRRFTGGREWAHLDIAGTARTDRDATGFGARSLVRLIESLA